MENGSLVVFIEKTSGIGNPRKTKKIANAFPGHLSRHVSNQLLHDPRLASATGHLNHSSTVGTCLQAVFLALPQLRITAAVTIRNWSDQLGLQPSKRYVQGRACLQGARLLAILLTPPLILQTFKHNQTHHPLHSKTYYHTIVERCHPASRSPWA